MREATFSFDQIRHLVFDFDNTLYPGNDTELTAKIWDGARRALIIAWLGKINQQIPPECELKAMVKEYVARGTEIGFTNAYKEKGGDPGEFARIAKNNPKAPYLKYDPKLVKTFKVLRPHVDSISVFTGSNRGPALEAINVLFRGNEGKYIDTLVGADDLPDEVDKPDQEAYELFLAMQNLAPQASLMVDDMPSEIRTATSLGMHGVLVGTNHQRKTLASVPAHIGNVYELPALFGLAV